MRPSSFRHAAHVVRHFASTRSVEVVALQAPPLLGYWLGSTGSPFDNLFPLALLLFGSLALTAHAFVFNDWANYHSDLRDPRRAPVRSGERVIGRRDIAILAGLLLLVAMVALALVGPRALLFGGGVAIMSFVYSGSSRFGKAMPVAASLNHVIGGALHFLLGYSFDRSVDARGIAIGLFFGLVFAAGHLNQEIRDHAADGPSGIRTSAVAFGCHRTFLASFALFTAAYALILGLAALGLLPQLLLLSVVLWVVQAVWSRQALRRGLGYDTAIWLQRRYRLLFALIGLTLLAGPALS
jgi:4-hydroxybenzoate polyprenyltransferase